MTGLPLRIAIVHPEMGIGGAERWAVDAAMQLGEAGHAVTVFTARHPERSFEETRDGRVNVRACAAWMPCSIGGRLIAPVSIVRMGVTALAAIGAGNWDVILCDLVAHAIPILRMGGAPVIFYCHYPDLLLASHSGWKRFYRRPIDALEAWALDGADRVLVNSRFTAAAVARSFPGLAPGRIDIVHPGVDTSAYANIPAAAPAGSGEIVLLSVNRIVDSKNLELALETLVWLKANVAQATAQRLRLIVAGGYDEAAPGARATLAVLRQRIHELGLDQKVRFELSVPQARLHELMRDAFCVLYTPKQEHFGYGPVEAMSAGRPVVAVNCGGPLETIEDQRSGFLCAPTAQAFGESVRRLLDDPELARAMGECGRRRARDFDVRGSGARLLKVVEDVTSSRAQADRQ